MPFNNERHVSISSPISTAPDAMLAKESCEIKLRFEVLGNKCSDSSNHKSCNADCYCKEYPTWCQQYLLQVVRKRLQLGQHIDVLGTNIPLVLLRHLLLAFSLCQVAVGKEFWKHKKWNWDKPTDNSRKQEPQPPGTHPARICWCQTGLDPGVNVDGQESSSQCKPQSRPKDHPHEKEAKMNGDKFGWTMSSM